jgi:hypothetical protein
VVRGTITDRCVVAGVPARVVREYVPGDGWSPPGSAGPLRERLEGIAQLPDAPG